MALYLAVVIGLSFGLYYLFRYLIIYFDIPMERVEEFASTAYLVVFGVTLVSNAAVFVPVALHVSVILTAASRKQYRGRSF